MREKSMPKRRKRFGIKWKMFTVLFLFVFAFAICIWVLEVQMLNYFYQTAKFRELDAAAESISFSLGNDISTINLVDECSGD